MDLREKANKLPAAPGVYLFKDAAGNLLYVGKAKNLRNRVRSYFTDDKLADLKTGTLLSEAADIEYILVDNEKEALALENNLIKQHKPRFNVLLRDDKTYPYIRLTKEKWPRVYVTRRVIQDGSLYFGPYFPANLAHRLVNFIHRYFKIPSCRIDLNRYHPQPCLEYHIHRCLGPCVQGLTTEEEYHRAVEGVKLFLEGRLKDLRNQLRQRMQEAAEQLRFEEAAALRDLIATIEEMEERQKMAAVTGDDADVFAVYAEPPLVAANVFHVRNGRVVDRQEFFWEDRHEFDEAEFFSSLLKQYYLDQTYVPPHIYVPVDFEDRQLLAEVLSEKRGRKVEINVPQRGQKRALLELAITNARHSFEQRFWVLQPSVQQIQQALQELVGMDHPPRRIECFDVSHIQGTDKVASMVVWEDGRMKKSDYRKFVIRTPGNDDYASMREAITRRYHRLLREGQKLPDLILVDGGVGQLHAAAEALANLGIVNPPLAAIAKREETLYVLGNEHDPIQLQQYSPLMRLIQRIRDEAHRFAVTFHRQRRSAARIRTELEEIPGIGPKTAQKLLEHFGSVEKIRQATETEWIQVAGRHVARRLKEYFHGVPASDTEKQAVSQ